MSIFPLVHGSLSRFASRATAAVLLVVAITAHVVSPSAAGAPEFGRPPIGFALWLQDQMRSQAIPGVSIAVVEGYRVRWAAGFGIADIRTGRKVTTDTPFQIASLSKPIAAIAIIESFAAHGVALNAPIAPVRFPDGSTWVLPNPYPEPVTADQLLSHTGGVAPFHYSGFLPGEVLPTLGQELNGQPPANTPPVAVTAPPGSRWDYAPGGYTILQTETEQQNNWRPFDEIADDLIFRVIPGLQSSTFSAPPSTVLANRLAVPYLPDGSALLGGPRVFNTEASGSMISTPLDMARIMIAFQLALAGLPSPIPTWVARAMMVRRPAPIADGHCMSTAEPGAADCTAPWGLGFDVNMDATFSHIPDGQPTGDWFGHSGFNSGYLGFFLANKSDGDGLVLMLNSGPADMTTAEIPELPFANQVIRRIADQQNWR